MVAEDYISLTRTHIPKWICDFKSRNLGNICRCYSDYLKALIKATPRVSKVLLQAAAVHCFGGGDQRGKHVRKFHPPVLQVHI